MVLGFMDGWYFAHSAWIILQSKRKPRRPLLATATYHSRVWFSDLDSNLHMNNGRYLRECDMCRFDLVLRNGIWGTLFRRIGEAQAAVKAGTFVPGPNGPNGRKPLPPSDWGMVVGSIHAQYRRSLNMLETYTVTARVISWDKRNFFVENRYESRRRLDKDGRIVKPTIYFVLLVRMTLVGGITTEDIVKELGHDPTPPPLPKHWVNFLDTTKNYKEMEKAETSNQAVGVKPQLAANTTFASVPQSKPSMTVQLPSRL